MEALDLFTHQYEIQLRFTDFDIMGHINNTKHLVFVESARIDYMETIHGHKLHEKEIMSIVAHVDIDYLKPIFPGQQVTIFTRCCRIGNKSYQLESLSVVGDLKDKESLSIVAKANAVIVSYDYKSETTFPLPTELIGYLTAYEKDGTILMGQK
jgi:acyl-CoA thioester hydrolase